MWVSKDLCMNACDFSLHGQEGQSVWEHLILRRYSISGSFTNVTENKV